MNDIASTVENIKVLKFSAVAIKALFLYLIESSTYLENMKHMKLHP